MLGDSLRGLGFMIATGGWDNRMIGGQMVTLNC